MTDETTAGWEAAPPLVSAEPKTTLTFSEVAGNSAEPDVDVAYRWAKLYTNDIEYEPFFTWIGRRSNPERTDFHDILQSLPMHWGPEQLPPPLRRHFLKRFSSN